MEHWFLDTNILVYAFDPDDPVKQAKARELIAPDRAWHISWQVVQEFIHVARHRFRKPLDPEYLQDLIDLLLAPKCRVLPSPHLWKSALGTQSDTQYRYHDSLIIAAALESGATTLYSEILPHGRRFGGLTILNPFL